MQANLSRGDRFFFFFRSAIIRRPCSRQPVTRQNLSLDVLRSRALPLLLLLPLLFIAACPYPHQVKLPSAPGSRGRVTQTGIAWYGPGFHGKATGGLSMIRTI